MHLINLIHEGNSTGFSLKFLFGLFREIPTVYLRHNFPESQPNTPKQNPSSTSQHLFVPYILGSTPAFILICVVDSLYPLVLLMLDLLVGRESIARVSFCISCWILRSQHEWHHLCVSISKSCCDSILPESITGKAVNLLICGCHVVKCLGCSFFVEFIA